MSLTAVIFDMDGVLVDSYQAHYQSWLETTQARGLSLSQEQFAQLYGHGFYVWVAALGGGHLDAAAVEQWYLDKEHSYRQAFRRDPAIMPGVEQLQRELHRAGVLMAVGSAGPRGNVDMVVELLPTGGLFAATVSADDVAQPKPAPDVFLEAARRLGVQARNCVVIEDSLHGLAAARAAGMACVGLAGTEPLAVLAQHADLAVSHLSELNVAVLGQVLHR